MTIKSTLPSRLTPPDTGPALRADETPGPLATLIAEVFLGLFLFTRLVGNNRVSLQAFLLPALGLSAVLLAPRKAVQRVPVSFAVLLFVAWIALSYTWSADPYITSHDLLLRLPGIFVAILCVGILPPAHFRRLILIFVSVMLLANIGYIALRPGIATHPRPGDIAPGWRGLFNHKNLLGMFGVLAIVTYLTLLPRSVIRNLILLGVGALILTTQSVTALSTSFLVVAAYLWVYRLHEQESPRLRTAYTVTTALLIPIGVALLASSLGNIVGLFGRDRTFTGRTRIWSAALHAIRSREWQGYGWAAPWNSLKGPTIAMQRSIGFDVFSAHNGALELMLEVGIIGLLLYVPVLLGALRSGFQAMHVHQRHGRFVVLTVIALTIASMSEPTFTGGGEFEWVILLYTSAMVVVLDNRYQHNRGHRPNFRLATADSSKEPGAFEPAAAET
jgi:exopolysaccharide production protein ExoQ